MDTRLPAHVEVSGLIRRVQAAGGFATLIARGERDAGTIVVICCENGANMRLFERMPQLDGSRDFTLIKTEDPENKQEFSEYCSRRHARDPDLWVVELDIADGERFILKSADLA